MNGNVSKQLVSLTRLIVVIAAVCVVSYLNRREALALRDDVEAVNILPSAASLDIGQVLKSADAAENVRRWIGENAGQIGTANDATRQSIRDWLESGGIAAKGISNLKETKPYNFSLTAFVFEPRELDMIEVKGTEYRYKRAASTLADYVERFRLMNRPRRLSIATGLVETLPPQVFSPRNGHEYRLESIVLHGDSVEVTLVEVVPASLQVKPDVQVITKPARIVQVDAPPILKLLGLQTSDQHDLYQEPQRLSRLETAYGTVSFQVASQTIQQGFMEAYKKVDILGFSFSTQKLPFAALLFLGLGVAGILLTVLRNRRRPSPTTPSEESEADGIDMTIETLPARLAMWSVLPVIAIVLSLPAASLRPLEGLVLWAGTLVVVSAGAAAARLSRSPKNRSDPLSPAKSFAI